MIRIFRHYISRWSLLLVLMETTIYLLSVYAGVALRFYSEAEPDDIHAEFLFWRALFFALVMLISMTATGRYQRMMGDGLAGELLSVGLSFIIGLVATSMLFYAFPDLFIGRGAFAFAWIVALIGVLLLRWIFYRFIVDTKSLQRRILICGTGYKARIVERMIDQDPRDMVIIGYWPVAGTPEMVEELRIIRSEQPLLQWCRNHQVSEVVLASDSPIEMPLMHDLVDCKAKRILVLDLPQFFEREERVIMMDALGPDWWVAYADGVNRHPFQELMKKSFDITLSLLLLFTLWPIMLMAALAVWAESGFRGPIFYRQTRVGFAGKPFHVWKFRSMRQDAERDGPQWAQQNDSRITKVGRVIRNTRIDELPQFYNVLHGEMSLVGPRPERPEFTELLQAKIPYYSERLRVKPGITGWAQIKYGYGASIKDAEEKLKYDLYYVKNHSLFFDLLVLIHSVEVVLFGKGVEASRSEE
uniref:Putative glycosyltransferase. Bacterial sugar transferase n=1 Tax=Magnetococcus massalia (strain MO-1) TaxID=451514 RepID=A0A1S7LPF1_MAGMO|nr:Putative glycosyltransferase. Bacterial sugar transferase [Candidatus Magnetococcus massalia]